MNRQYRRLMKKQQEAGPKTPARPAPRQPGAPGKKERTPPMQFLREVGGELQKVAWPNRQEVIAYFFVVLVSLVIITAIIFAMDFVFTEAVLFLFGVE